MKGFIVAVFCGLLVGCDLFKVTPVDLSNYAILGQWYGEQQLDEGNTRQQVYLKIQPDGLVTYYHLICRHLEDAQRAVISDLRIVDFPVKRLSPTAMVLQKYPFSPQFRLTLAQWPSAEVDRFQVDEVVLSRWDQSSIDDQWGCDE